MKSHKLQSQMCVTSFDVPSQLKRCCKQIFVTLLYGWFLFSNSSLLLRFANLRRFTNISLLLHSMNSIFSFNKFLVSMAHVYTFSRFQANWEVNMKVAILLNTLPIFSIGSISWFLLSNAVCGGWERDWSVPSSSQLCMGSEKKRKQWQRRDEKDFFLYRLFTFFTTWLP